MRTLFFAALLGVPLVSGCAAVAAGAAGGYLAQNELMDNSTHTLHVDKNVQELWAVAKTSLSEHSSDVIEVDDELRSAKGRVNGSMVTVRAEAFDLEKSVLRVRANKFGMTDGQTAELVLYNIRRRLES